MEKDVISLKGDKDKWLDFAVTAKKNKQQIWDALEQMIDKYIAKAK